MRFITALVTGIAVLAGGHLVLASEPTTTGKNPYSRLFEPQAKMAPPQRSGAPAAESKPRVVCGMTVIPADMSIDPKMQMKRKDSPTRYAIRSVPPPMCK
jgi:hypothetical protein